MRLHVLCVSKRPSDWVARASQEYLKRLTGQLDVSVTEVSPAALSTRALSLDKEAAKLRRAMPRKAYTIALDERGRAWSTIELAAELDRWRGAHGDVVCLIGGAAGLAPSLLDEADGAWSLSPLTLPHQLVRVILIEQIYRAWSVLNNHPYHRE
ncbi:MAG: 23S rRNA (pseudouridine(1915)-N(3))-methyltransferase RlmH [Gammaproteobacteria bacterium]|jgi:23S rRNA (pseudouridine1915-N3)-methyltransferase